MKLPLMALAACLLLPHTARAEIQEELGCVPAEKAAKYVQLLGVQTEQFGPLELCESTNLNKKLLDAIHSLELGRFSRTSASPLTRRVVEGDYLPYLTERIDRVERNGCSGDETVVACVKPGQTTMHLQDYFFRLPAVNRVGTLLHEARHIDGFPHVDCESGPLAGSPGGCDPRWAYRGSYAVELEYYARVALEGENFHPVYRTIARASAVALMEENFNEAPAQPRERLAIVHKDGGGLSLFDGDRVVERPGAVIRDARLIARRYGLAALPFDRAANTWLLDPYSPSSSADPALSPLLGTLFESYNRVDPARRPHFIDILNRRDMQARLFGDRLELTVQPQNRGDDLLQVKLATEGLGLKNFAASRLCWRPDPIFGNPRVTPVQVLGAQGILYQVKNLFSWEEAPKLEALPCVLPEDLREATEYGGRFLGLLEGGRIVELPRDGGEVRAFAPLEDVRAEQILVFPYYDELE